MKKKILNLMNENYDDYPIKKGRLKFVFVVLILIFFVICSRLLYLSVFINKNNHTFISPDDTIKTRGNIVDRNGILIASDIELVNFYLNRELVSKPKETAKSISKIFPELEEEKIFQRIISTKNKAKFILIKKNITPKQQNDIKNSDIVGFEFNNSLGRIYPHANLFSHVVGYVDIDRNGIAGVEMEYNDFLNKTSYEEPLKLTLDVRIQSILRQQLLKAIDKYNAKSAIGIVSEIKTGNILGIVNLPDFDPNKPALADQASLYNKATYGVYEMGSIFKVFTIANALDNDIIQINDEYDVSQTIKFGKYEIKQERYTDKFLTPEEILIGSSNVGSALIGMQIGNQGMRDFLNNLGMFQKVPMKFPSLATPLVPEIWRDITTITASYGHGISITPLHIIRAINGVVNKGIMTGLKFVEGEDDENNSSRIIKEDTSKIMSVYLRNVVRKGTGWRANTLGYAVGGKTGSARLLKDGEYQEGNIMANFIGIFPMNNPHYSIYIMIESPKIDEEDIEITGGIVATPVFARILENIAPILNIIPYVERIEE